MRKGTRQKHRTDHPAELFRHYKTWISFRHPKRKATALPEARFTTQVQQTQMYAAITD
jgi:hypothetical protein